MSNEFDIGLPAFPEITESDFLDCAKNYDFRPILFEWYKHIGILCCSICSIARQSPVWKNEPTKIQHGILIGLINRCAKLIHSNMALSHEGINGEATSIIDRCIFESSVKIRWLCLDLSPEKFTRYLSDGLKSDIDAKKIVLENIKTRGYQTEIEKRILNGVEKRISQSGLLEEEIEGSAKLQNLATMIQDLNLPRTLYVFGQKISSHNVHGNWSSLLWYNLTVESNGEFSPNDDFAPTVQDQYAGVIRNVLAALRSYVNSFGLKDPDIGFGINQYFDAIDDAIDEMQSILTEPDSKDSGANLST